jgi:hypothetical protein
MSGRPFDLGTSVARGLRRFFPVLGTSICFVLVVALASILFVIPGLIVLAMYALAMPICVVEGLGPIQSLDRSGRLTKGYRWRVFVTYIVPVLVLVGGASLVEKVGTAHIGVAGGVIADFVFAAIFSPYASIVPIVAYHDLRVAKEGLDIDKLAVVFE